MQHLVVGLLLDDGAREAVRVFIAVAILVLLALLLAVATPAMLLSSPGGPVGPYSAGQAPSVDLPRTASAGLARTTPGSDGDLAAGRGLAPALAGSLPVEMARRYLGVRYVFGGVNPATGLDCSGLVQLVFHQLGIALPRTAQQQYDATPRVGRDQLQPGDVVFFARTYADPHDWITHVGIYIGDGLQINAPDEGQVVSVQPVFSGYWGAHYAGAGRAVAN